MGELQNFGILVGKAIEHLREIWRVDGMPGL